MSCYFRQNSETEISVPKFIESSTGVTYYDIKIKVKNVEWMVERRYKDFDQLHEKLVEELSISKKLLPPKKVCFSSELSIYKSNSINSVLDNGK